MASNWPPALAQAHHQMLCLTRSSKEPAYAELPNALELILCSWLQGLTEKQQKLAAKIRRCENRLHNLRRETDAIQVSSLPCCTSQRKPSCTSACSLIFVPSALVLRDMAHLWQLFCLPVYLQYAQSCLQSCVPLGLCTLPMRLQAGCSSRHHASTVKRALVIRSLQCMCRQSRRRWRS